MTVNDGRGGTAVSSITVQVNPAPDTTPPTIPSGLAVTAVSSSQINLTWNASSDPESGVANYKVYRNGVLIASPTAASYNDSGLSPSTAYTYTVSAVNIVNLESAQSASVTKSTPASNASGLIAWWKFDESSSVTAADSSGDNVSGSLQPSSSLPTWLPSGGKINGCIQFNGNNNYVDVGNPQPLHLTGAMSVSAWIYLDASGSSGRIIAKQGGPADRGWSLNVETTGGVASFGVSDTSNAMTAVFSTGAIPTGQWVHLVGTYDPGASVRIYVNATNGTPNASAVSGVPAAQRDSTLNVNIGRRPDGGNAFPGKVDDIQIYNRVLSSSEIASLASAGGTSVNHSPVVDTNASALPSQPTTGQNVNFNVAAHDPDSDPLTYSWNFGDGALGSSATATHAYTTVGTYTATVTISDGKGGSATSSTSVTVNAVSGLAVAVTFVSTGKSYTTTTAAVGAAQFIDRTYSISSISAGLNGGVLIQTSNDDKVVTLADHLDFSVNTAAHVYVLYDTRLTMPPAWLDSSWVLSTTESASTTDGSASPYKIYAKNVPAGTIHLGGNAQAPQSAAASSYFVIVKP